MAGFNATISLPDVNTALDFITYAQSQKAINTARKLKNAAQINATIDIVCNAIIDGADPASIKAYQLAQFAPASPAAPPTTTPAP